MQIFGKLYNCIFFQIIMSKLRSIINVSNFIKRDLRTNVPALQKVVDPIQQLFLDKLREYKTKSG